MVVDLALERVEDEVQAVLEFLGELDRGRRVTPVMDRTYPLHELALTMGRVGTAHTRGKVAISV